MTSQPAMTPKLDKGMFAEILATVGDGISVQDLNFRVIYANAAQKELFGSEVVGKHCYEIYEHQPQRCEGCPVHASYQTGEVTRAHRHGYDVSGNELTVEIIASPIRNSEGEIVAGVEVVRNVTEQIKARDGIVRTTERLRRLAEMAREISSGLDLGEVLQRVVKSAVELTGADGGTVALLDPVRHRITYPYHYKMPESLASVTVPEGQGLAGHIIKTGKPVTISDYPAFPAQVPAFTEAGVKTVLGLPMAIGDRVLGVLGIFSKEMGSEFSREDQDIAIAIADQAAVAIENARLFGETDKRLRVQKELTKVALSITSGLDLEKVLSQVVCHAADVLKADAASIAMLDEERGVITFPYFYNLPPELSHLTRPRDAGLAARVINSNEPIIENNYQGFEDAQAEFVGAGINAVATVPLKVGGRSIGAIGVMDTGSGQNFDDEDIEILSIISTQAAVAVDNARLYEELTHSAQQLEARVKERTEALSRMYEESKRKSLELEEANKRLREVDRLKSEFLANMSHELRTPLNSIIGFSKLIIDGLDGEINGEQQHDLEIVHTNGQELLRLIDDLLDLAKIEAGRMSLALQEGDPAKIVSDVLMSMRATADEKHLLLESEMQAGLRPVVMDSGKVKQILMNLVGNAIKFTQEGGITIHLEQTSQETIFSVSDTGIGLSPEQHKLIFDRFHQAAPGLADTAGIGLGLTISKRFVEMHGGRIWLDSDVGKGSKFYFSIPQSRTTNE